MNDSPFARRTVRVLVGIGGVSLLVMIWLFVADLPPERGPSAGPDSFSRSAVGHRALLEVLERLDVPVTVSRFDTGRRAGRGALLLLLEPRARSEEERRRLRDTVAKARNVLLALPKRTVVPDPANPEFVTSADLLPASEAQAVLDAIGVGGTVVRAGAPVAFPASDFGPGPETAGPPQLVHGLAGSASLTAPGGVILGRARIGDATVWVLADPDPVENHGLARGDNATFAVGLVDGLRGGGPVLVDEEIHGYSYRPSLFAALLRFPLLLATVHGGLVLAVLLFAAVGRFGPPRPEKPAFAPGKGVILRNTAELLAAGTYAGHVLRSYLAATLHEIVAGKEARTRPSKEERTARLERLEARRRPTRTARELEALVSRFSTGSPRVAARALALARDIHEYRREMLDGTR